MPVANARRCLLWGGLVLLVLAGGVRGLLAQYPSAPRPEAVAETRLLMQGIDQPNFRGLENLLKSKPQDVETWSFLRGQALLIAESGNLLMLRPPRAEGREIWLERAGALRRVATRLARAAAAQDYAASQARLTELANTCNQCHVSFRVPIRLGPESENKPEPKPVPRPIPERRPGDEPVP